MTTTPHQRVLNTAKTHMTGGRDGEVVRFLLHCETQGRYSR